MPRSLLDRRQPESIREFRAAARERFHDGMALAASGRRTGAIYLWGYSVEMMLKAAYFSLTLADTDPITYAAHIVPAIQHARRVRGIPWPFPGQGHNVRAWAELLVAERAAIPGAAYRPEIGREVQRWGQRVGHVWSETLRYHKNVAYSHEVARVREGVEWILINADVL